MKQFLSGDDARLGRMLRQQADGGPYVDASGAPGVPRGNASAPGSREPVGAFAALAGMFSSRDLLIPLDAKMNRKLPKKTRTTIAYPPFPFNEPAHPMRPGRECGLSSHCPVDILWVNPAPVHKFSDPCSIQTVPQANRPGSVSPD